ncbi:MAG: aminoglycoside phosphotransferase family protein [Sphingomonas sp.]|jgi:thiamine kinase|nr:MAG: aminoglycoside phosphotransferase family protein [Sphingomonas sp.]
MTEPTLPVDRPPDSQIIGRGESGEVFGLDERTALKLFFPNIELHTVEREMLASAAAFRQGLLVGEPIEIVRIGDRHGLVMRRLDGPVLLRKVGATPIGMTVALIALARWHTRLHAQPADVALPRMKAVLTHQVAVSVVDASSIAAAARVLRDGADGDRLCHGDLHFGNIIATPDGLAAIDWAKAYVGMAEADVARSELLIRYGSYGRFMRRFPPARILRHVSAEWYLLWYCLLSGRRRRDILRWRLPVAVAWMQGQATMFVPGLTRAIARMTKRQR